MSPFSKVSVFCFVASLLFVIVQAEVYRGICCRRGALFFKRNGGNPAILVVSANSRVNLFGEARHVFEMLSEEEMGIGTSFDCLRVCEIGCPQNDTRSVVDSPHGWSRVATCVDRRNQTLKAHTPPTFIWPEKSSHPYIGLTSDYTDKYTVYKLSFLSDEKKYVSDIEFAAYQNANSRIIAPFTAQKFGWEGKGPLGNHQVFVWSRKHESWVMSDGDDVNLSWNDPGAEAAVVDAVTPFIYYDVST